jgi:hypothetical protein
MEKLFVICCGARLVYLPPAIRILLIQIEVFNFAQRLLHRLDRLTQSRLRDQLLIVNSSLLAASIRSFTVTQAQLLVL